MRRTYCYDPDLDAVVQIAGPGTNHPEKVPGAGMHIIRDIEPYRTAASDVAHEGKRIVVGSRSEHRRFLRDNGYIEVGNETPGTQRREYLSREERVNDIRRAMGDFGSNTRD